MAGNLDEDFKWFQFEKGEELFNRLIPSAELIIHKKCTCTCRMWTERATDADVD